ncbi:hypothetical protein [Azohydromonas caseinilytica]|uniref:Uncharacterized protein n=1 Tax=Azohydromonas caseinilytica TaxID=2728836 RepID=A0A848F7W2_9BURK|nr:hypothetical protein [Azohydromonas caseinilytica]NML14805.1 hypothetical protein [Azohydromonas caseinilytica]
MFADTGTMHGLPTHCAARGGDIFAGAAKTPDARGRHRCHAARTRRRSGGCPSDCAGNQVKSAAVHGAANVTITAFQRSEDA